MGMISREEMEAAVMAGGSVMLPEGLGPPHRVVTSIDQLPTQAQIDAFNRREVPQADSLPAA